MKEQFFIQVGHGESEIGFLKNEAKTAWKASGNLVKDMKSVDFYIKPHENKCYYVINEEFNGSIDLF